MNLTLVQNYPPHVKEALLALLSGSDVVEASVWVDGNYVPIEDVGMVNKWIEGRDVYFKLVGKIERGSQ